ncbi:glutamate receptor-like [Procambarus clarkii]|uniref:glutamate receptor-like n=1 Tax=Procambarus clarkii TaxID=6728 RepID=UPI0037431105
MPPSTIERGGVVPVKSRCAVCPGVQSAPVRQVSWCVTVVVVSDDLAFLAAFAQWSLKGRLLVSSTRLLVLTDDSLLNHPTLSGIYSKMNAMLLVVKNLNELQECSVYMQQPYSPQRALMLKVASWTPRRGLTLTSSLQLFPDKFSRLSNGPHLVVASETYPTHDPVMVDDPKTPGRKVLRFFSALAKVLQLLADTTNFTYTYVRPHDGIWGTQQSDGSWTGMVGIVRREEVEIGLGPFPLNNLLNEAVDATWPVTIEYGRLLGGRGQPEVDPWGFLFPLEPLVWAAILAALLVLPLAMCLMSSCFSLKTPAEWMDDTFNLVSLISNQGIMVQNNWWWERVVMAVWGLVTVVLTQSYAGNLMALLAVRHIPQPIQSLEEIVNDHSVALLVSHV